MSGYLEEGDEPLERARTGIQEETSLLPDQITLVRQGELLRAFDEDSGTVWIVHPFLFEVEQPTVQLDWEHTESKWVYPKELGAYETVPKLKEAFDRVRWDLQDPSASLSSVLEEVDDVAHDKVHGASSLGQRSLENMAETVRASDAKSQDELLRDLLLVAFRLRKAQPSMSSIRNQVGKFLHDFELERGKSDSVPELRNLAISLTERANAASAKAAVEAARSCASIIPDKGIVLTHSYSSIVCKALETAAQTRNKPQVCVTESRPGLEGRRLAKDLAGYGLSVTLIADSAVGATLPGVSLVLVGADSVLADGSAMNKVGTKAIALTASAEGIPVYIGCETTKFSTVSLLGEPVEIQEMDASEILGDIKEPLIGAKNPYFDITSAKYISRFVTEEGFIKPSEVDGRIRRMLREIYP